VRTFRRPLLAVLLGLCLAAGACQSTTSEITLQNRTTADVILLVDDTHGTSPYLIPGCGRVVFDPSKNPADRDPSSTHPSVAVIPYKLSLVPDAPTIATVVITTEKIYSAYGPPPTLPACAGDAPTGSPG